MSEFNMSSEEVESLIDNLISKDTEIHPDEYIEEVHSVRCAECGKHIFDSPVAIEPIYCSDCYNKIAATKPLSKLARELESANAKQQSLHEEELKSLQDKLSRDLEEYKRAVDNEYKIKEENLLNAFKAIREFIDLSMKNVK